MTQLKAILENVLGDEAGGIEPGDNLFGHGLHSLMLMRFIPPLSRIAGRRLDYDELARQPRLPHGRL